VITITFYTTELQYNTHHHVNNKLSKTQDSNTSARKAVVTSK